MKNIWDLGKSAVPGHYGAGNITFMEWKGDNCTPGFSVDLASFDGITQAYRNCSMLKTISNRNAAALTNGRWWIVDRKDNDVAGKYKGLARILRRPNPIQSWNEFVIQLDVYRQIYGEVFVYAVVPAGFSVQEASALWVINPSYVEVDVSGKAYMQSEAEDIIRAYYLRTGGQRTELERGHVLFIRDINQNIGMSQSDIRGESRLIGLEKSIRNIIQAEEAVYALNKDRGAQGILSNETKDVVGKLDMTPEEREKVQREYMEAYGLSRGQRKVIITDANLKWQQMSFNVRDLMLFEGMEYNIQRIADSLDYPYELLSHTAGVTYANKLEAKRFHYQNTVIPLAMLYAEKFTEFFGLDRHLLTVDFSGVECLIKSEVEKADTLCKQNEALSIAYEKGVISLAEWRLAMGMDEEIYKPDSNNSENGQGE